MPEHVVIQPQQAERMGTNIKALELIEIIEKKTNERTLKKSKLALGELKQQETQIRRNNRNATNIEENCYPDSLSNVRETIFLKAFD